MHENLLKSIPTKPWINPLFRPLVVFICMILERILMRKIPVIFAENSYIKHYPWVKKNITVLNMPLTSQLLQINETKYSKPTLGYIGGVTPERGSIVTLDALKILKSKGYAVDWECIGPTDNAHRKEIGNIIKRYGLEEQAVLILQTLPISVGGTWGCYMELLFSWRCLNVTHCSGAARFYRTAHISDSIQGG